MSSIELGGNFCLSEEQLKKQNISDSPFDNTFLGWKDVMFTHGGRSAIINGVREMGLIGTTVFIPNFSCHSITDAFTECDCKPFYYKTNRDLTINVESLMNDIKEKKPSILYTCPLFGFDTLESLRPHYQEIKEMGVIIMEDVTHSLLSSNGNENADIIVCSLRKWMEIPDGGFVSGMSTPKIQEFYESTPSPIEIVDNFKNASESKLKYFSNQDENLKDIFLPLFYKNNEIFGESNKIYKMSNFSYRILKEADFNKISLLRRRNYKQLLEKIKNPLIEFIFPNLKDNVVPLYMQVYVGDGRRDALQKHLVKHKLYCPIIWPTPQTVVETCESSDISNHKEMLSLVIDQRYDEEDMDRLAKAINSFNLLD